MVEVNGARGRVLVLTPDLPNAVGGVKIHYQVADALNAANIPAAVVHYKPGFRCDWFENKTRIEYAGQLILADNDVVVVPEEWVNHVPLLPSAIPKIVFNQNTYSMFSWGFDWQTSKAVYAAPDLRRVVVVSNDNKSYLKHAFPDLDVVRMRYTIDPLLFHANDAKTRALAYMPRKRRQETIDVLSLLHLRGALEGWEVICIDGFDEAATAAALRRSSVFLSFSQREGCPLPPAEAMACGCLVVGFHGYGGRDFGDRAFWITDGDVVQFATKLEEVLTQWEERREEFTAVGRSAAEHIATTYSAANRDADVISAFGGVRAAGSGRALGPLPTAFWDPTPLWHRAAGRLSRAARTLLHGS